MAVVPNTIGGFPDERINPKDKEEEKFQLAYAKAAFNTYNSLPDGTIGYRSRDKYEKIRAYVLNRQDISRYQRILSPGDGTDADLTYNALVVDWSTLPIISKSRRIALGLMEKMGYNIIITPIDPLAAGELLDTLNELRAKVLLREILPKAGMPQLAEAPSIAKQPDEPDDLDGVGVAEIGLRHKIAMEAEQVVEYVFNLNDWEGLRREVAADLFDYGVAIVKDDTSGCGVTVRKCDPRRMILSYCTEPDLSDLRYIGEVKNYPLSKVEAMSSGQVSKSDLEEIYNMSGRLATNPFGQSFGSWEEAYSKGKVQVLDLEYISSDHLAREERVDKRGNPRFGKARYSDGRVDKEKFKVKVVESVYRVKWIVGTDIVFDYGRQRNIKRDPKNKARAFLSYHVVTSDIHDMRAYSRTEAITGYADAIQLAYYKLQHALNTAVPKGIAIDVGALEEIALTTGGGNMSKADILDMYLTKGIMLFRRTSLITSNGTNNLPFIELQGGVGNEIAEYQTVINQNLSMIQQTLGLNDLTDGSTPNPKVLTTIAQMAAMGTNNALSDLYFADKKLAQTTSESVIIRAQDLIRDGKGEGFMSALGSGTVTLLKSIPQLDKYTFGIRIEDKPTPQQEEAFEIMLQKAVQAGQIDPATEIAARNMPNLKQREMFLAYKIRRFKEEQQQIAQRQIQDNADASIRSAQAAAELDMKRIQLEYDLKLRNEQQVKDLELRNLNAAKQFDLEEERIAASGRVESSFVQATAKDASNIRDNTTKLMKENKSEGIPTIDIPANLQSRVDPLTSEGEPLEITPFSFLQS